MTNIPLLIKQTLLKNKKDLRNKKIFKIKMKTRKIKQMKNKTKQLFLKTLFRKKKVRTYQIKTEKRLNTLLNKRN